MPVKFEWQTEEVEAWDEEKVSAEETAVPRRWLAVGIGLLVLLGGITVYILLDRQATAVTQKVTDDVLASHRVVQEAIANRDMELFQSLLFPFDRDWEEVQRTLWQRQLLVNRIPLGFWAKSVAATGEPLVMPAPDLQTAVVVADVPYVVETGETMTETLVLQQTAVYALDESRWWLAPPDQDQTFWGRQESVSAGLLTLKYPARDGEIARQLAADLSGALVELCDLAAVRCPADYEVALTLETEYQQLAALARNYTAVNLRRSAGNRFVINLPTPTLVGLPVDEAGYQALYLGYAGWITAVLINQFNRAQQPDHAQISQLLAQIDLQPPPANWFRAWQVTFNRSLPLPAEDILTVCQVANEPPHLLRFQEATASWVEEADVMSADALTQYSQLFVIPLPDDSGALLLHERYGTVDRRFDAVLWVDGEGHSILTSEGGSDEEPIYPLLSQFYTPTPPGSRLLFWQLGESEDGGAAVYWLDLAGCPEQNCSLKKVREMEALPIWSPDGSRTLLLGSGEGGYPTLLLGDAETRGQAPVGVGWSPLWLDDETFAFLSPDDEVLEEGVDVGAIFYRSMLVTAVVDDVTPEPLLHSHDLLAALPEERRPAKMALSAALPDPNTPGRWFIHAGTSMQGTGLGESYTFAYEEQTDDLRLLFTQEGGARETFLRLEGNGRYLAGFSSENSASQYFVYNLEEERMQTYPLSQRTWPGVDWSADGRWFALGDEDGALHLVAPALGYEIPLLPGMAQCNGAVWVAAR